MIRLPRPATGTFDFAPHPAGRSHETQAPHRYPDLNPFAILLLFRTRRFDAHWFMTGTPKFLVDTLIGRGVETPALDGMFGTNELLSAFDTERG